MGKSYLAAAAAAAGLLLALGASAEAGGKGGGPPTTPHGFSSPGGHGGFETFTNTGPPPATARLPGGWDQGKADWKSNLQDPPLNSILTTRPPGLSGH
jgi:hypothetical protein